MKLAIPLLAALVCAACTKAAQTPPDPQKKHRAELEQQAKSFRAQLSQNPNDLEKAALLAQVLIELSRVASEPSFKTEAEQVIGKWAESQNPHPKALIMRATIRQSRHDFDGALADLEAALKLAPSNAQGWLTLSVILGVRGELEAALKACMPLQQLSHALAFTGCEASILGLSGRSNEARERLERALFASPQVSAAEKIWALTILAELCARIGDHPSAESAYRRAFAAGVRDEYLLASYADFLLDAQKYAEVIQLLEKEANVDPLLLRLTIAEKTLAGAHAANGAKHAAALGAVFAQNRARGDLTHQREEARYLLELAGNPREALRVARDNWSVQREPWDVRVLLAAALAAGDKNTAQPALEFIDKTKLEDVRILGLAEKVRALP